MLNYKSVILILLIVGAAGILYLLQTKDSSFNLSEKIGPAEAVPAPDFTLPDLNGRLVSLSDFKGQVVLLNIWATWCGPCVEEMPSMQKLHSKLKDEGLVILAVSIDEAGAGVVRPFMEQHRLSFTALTDTAGSIKDLYRVTGVPETFIIDKNGIITQKIVGPMDWSSAGAIGYFRKLIQSGR